MQFTYTTQPHPTCKGKLLAIAPIPEHWHCATDTELAFVTIGGTHWRGHQESGSVAYTLSLAQARDLDLILRAGFRPASQLWNGTIDPEDRFFWHPEREGDYFTRSEALEIARPAARCSGTLEMDFEAPLPEESNAAPAAEPAGTVSEYSIGQAWYAKDRMAVRCPSSTGYKTRAARLIGDGLNCRYSGRDSAYIASRAQVERFERLYRCGFDACFMSGKLDHSELRLRKLDWRAADRVALWLEEQPSAWAMFEMLDAGDAMFDIGQLERVGVQALNELVRCGILEKGRAHWSRMGPLKTYWQALHPRNVAPIGEMERRAA